MLIGVDYHPSFQQIAFLVKETGEYSERRLNHSDGGGASRGAEQCGLATSVLHLAIRRHKSIAKVAMGRRLGVRLYWMWRNGWEYSQSLEFGSHAGQLGTGHGVN